MEVESGSELSWRAERRMRRAVSLPGCHSDDVNSRYRQSVPPRDRKASGLEFAHRTIAGPAGAVQPNPRASRAPCKPGAPFIQWRSAKSDAPRAEAANQ